MGRHLLFIREILLQHIRFVLVVSLLRADVKTPANQRIGIDIVDDIPIHSLHEFVWRQAMQHGLAFGRVRRADNEACGR